MTTNHEIIEINGVEVELRWGEGLGLGRAVHTLPAEDIKEGPCDGETFALHGKHYRLGAHEYSTDQPSGDGEDVTMSAQIYEEKE